MTRHARLAAVLVFLGAMVWLGLPPTVQADGTKVFSGTENPLGLHPMPPVPQPPHHLSWQHRPAQYPYAYAAPMWPAGYWSYVWVPQVYAAWVFVPAGFRPDGTWVDEHSEPRFVEGGYYQPVWVGSLPQ